MLIGFNFLMKNKPKIKKHKASTIVGKFIKKKAILVSIKECWFRFKSAIFRKCKKERLLKYSGFYVARLIKSIMPLVNLNILGNLRPFWNGVRVFCFVLFFNNGSLQRIREPMLVIYVVCL